LHEKNDRNSDPHYIAVADINGDGKSDIVTTNYGSSSFSVLMHA